MIIRSHQLFLVKSFRVALLLALGCSAFFSPGVIADDLADHPVPLIDEDAANEAAPRPEATGDIADMPTSLAEDEGNFFTGAAAGAVVCGIGTLVPELVFGVAPVCLGGQLHLVFGEHWFVTATFGGDAMLFRADPGYSFVRLGTRVDGGWMSTGRLRFGVGASATAGVSFSTLLLVVLAGQFQGDFAPFLGPFLDAQVGGVGKVAFDLTDSFTVFFDLPIQAGVYLFALPALVVTPTVGIRLRLF